LKAGDVKIYDAQRLPLKKILHLKNSHLKLEIANSNFNVPKLCITISSQLTICCKCYLLSSRLVLKNLFFNFKVKLEVAASFQ
jgi:hypothetical protein